MGPIETSHRCCKPSNVTKDMSDQEEFVLQNFSEHLIWQISKNGSQIMGFYVFIFLKTLSLTVLSSNTPVNYLPVIHM